MSRTYAQRVELGRFSSPRQVTYSNGGWLAERQEENLGATMRCNSFLSETERNAVIELRHAMHREPELSNAEWKTQARIRDMLRRFGLADAKVFHNTGLYVDIEGTASGPKRSIAVRGDIDALPIQETRQDLSYCSRVDGVMHACGHDIHASIALGTALAFHRLRGNFAGRLRVFFQPAEEAEPLGGRTVAAERLLDGFDRAVGFHVNPESPAGVFDACEGAITKSADQFKLTFSGKMAHGAAPHQGVDAIAIAAAFVNEVQKVVSREMPADDGAILTIGTIHGGNATNIICPSVALEGTVRTGSPERRGLLCQRVREVAEAVALMHRGRAECDIQAGEPAVFNDAEMVRRFRQVVQETVGAERLTSKKRVGGSDDFGFYSASVPSIYFWFGSRAPGNDSHLHTPTFAASDDLIIPTTELAIRYILDLLNSRIGPPFANATPAA
ncbi:MULTISPECIES: M20 metallopeptidase family protein [unclassified Bradyrhizobium]|uniref:M20 metallopeptidase family protein n=1 Tax=Bradyrhizobium sp. USDA 4541 TaxID=2817704 RepID=UPI0020A591EF|nr:M20 family metallopeptidase [Bradyrhizobium sp. USDA 4541]MCP1854526.1 amidohydrolase [Bradyrhizobium sp. USDA 4541]